jgi:hypothetical protein
MPEGEERGRMAEQARRRAQEDSNFRQLVP